ncbi:hypothetical protein Tco_1404691 [Tanacetum coccineum]
MSGSVGSNVNVRVNIVDGKLLKLNTNGKVKNVAGKPFQVRRKVAIGHDDANIIWEVTETNFPSPLKSVWREEPATCDASPCEVSKLANAVNTCTKFKDNLEHDVPSSDNMTCCGLSEVGNEAGTNEIEVGNSNSPILKSFNSVLSPNGAANVIPDGSPTKASVLYANPLNSKRVNFRSLLNEEKVESYDCVLPQDIADVVKNRYENTIVGYFLGKSLAFPIVQNYVNIAWSNFGLQKLMKTNDWVFMFKFASKEVGKSFVKGPVDDSSESESKVEVTMAISNKKGDGYTKEVIRVEYEWKPPYCSDCKFFEHDLLQCPKHVKENAFNDPSKVFLKPCNMEGMDTVDTTGDAFKEVKRKKNKGKRTDQQPRPKHIDIFWINKPKPNHYWQKKGINMRGVDIDTMTQVDANSKAKGPCTSNSFDALKDVGDDCGVSSSWGSQEKEPEARIKTSQLMEHCDSDDEVDEYIFSEGDKFGDKFDIRLKGRVRK